MWFILVCSLLIKKYQKCKSKKKFGPKKKIKTSKRKEKREEKRSTQGTPNSSIVCGAFCLVHISVATFHTYFTPLFVTTTSRNTYRPATRTSALDIYSILLSGTDLCATYTYLFFCVPPKLHIYFRSVEKNTLAILVLRPHRYHEPATGCTIHCFALVRTPVRIW